MIDDATRRQWRRMFDARTAGPWAHEPGSGKIISVTYRRGVAEVTHYEDTDFVAQAYDGWPRTLEALEAAERERDEARDGLEFMRREFELRVSINMQLVQERDDAAERARIATNKLALSAGIHEATLQNNVDLHLRIDELERMLTAWRKHRNSPLLIADFDNYKKRNP